MHGFELIPTLLDCYDRFFRSCSFIIILWGAMCKFIILQPFYAFSHYLLNNQKMLIGYLK